MDRSDCVGIQNSQRPIWLELIPTGTFKVHSCSIQGRRYAWSVGAARSWWLVFRPIANHYQCNLYYLPETRKYQISGSTTLFLQQCQLLYMTLHQHLHALMDKLTNCSAPTSTTPKGKRLFCMIQEGIALMLAPSSTAKEQRVSNNLHQEAEQGVIDDTPIIHIPRLTDTPGIMELRNPMAKHALKLTPCLHWRVTQNNTPGILPVPILDGPPRGSPCVVTPQTNTPLPAWSYWQIVTQHAINGLMELERQKCKDIFIPTLLLAERTPHLVTTHFGHFTCPTMHPMTIKTILSYKKWCTNRPQQRRGKLPSGMI